MAENPQAFPISELGTHGTYGMSLRDYFAAKAMVAGLHVGLDGVLRGEVEPESTAIFESKVAQSAYRIADAMLAAREAASKWEVERG